MRQTITWKTNDKFPNVEIGDNIVMKAKSLDDIPEHILKNCFKDGKLKINDDSLCKYILHGKLNFEDQHEKYSIERYKLWSYNGISYFDPFYIKKFLLKSSQVYVNGDNKAALIINKNYICVVASCLPEEGAIFTPDEPEP